MIDILMATYNGEKYIREQIDSILSQTNNDWKLFVRDDGSTDSTVQIVKDYANNYPEKIKIIQDNKGGLGAKLNFGELIKVSKSNYCMFCDQDDVWMDDKIEKTLNAMKVMESKYGKDIPILIHTDLEVVDENLKTIDNSFFKFQNINPLKNKVENLLFSNTVTGCTMMINKSLVELIEYIPKESNMHDWWIALVASYIGKIYTIDEPTIKYRQHSNNTIGASKYNKNISLKRFINNKDKYKHFAKCIIEQAEIFKLLYNDKNLNINNNYIDKVIELKNKSYISKRVSIIKNKLFKGRIKQNIILFMYI